MSPGKPIKPLREIRITAAAVPGCQHVVTGNGAPCQDAARTFIDEDCAIIAISDGHGDPHYTHSDEGARIAVGVAVDALKTIVARLPDESADDLTRLLKKKIVFEWNRRVKHHARMVAAMEGSALLWPDEVTGEWDEKTKPYGATLVAALATATHLVWLRLGDGDAFHATKDRAKRIFSTADKSMGQATYSLSMRSALAYFDVIIAPAFLEDDEQEAQLLVLATDGVSDQYDVDPSAEDEWGAKMFARVEARGFTDTVMDLPRHLGTVARDGDDCSVAMMWIPPGASQ